MKKTNDTTLLEDFMKATKFTIGDMQIILPVNYSTAKGGVISKLGNLLPNILNIKVDKNICESVYSWMKKSEKCYDGYKFPELYFTVKQGKEVLKKPLTTVEYDKLVRIITNSCKSESEILYDFGEDYFAVTNTTTD